eukprot:g3629.t1 g3629   contig12:2454048-2455803(+)
MATIAENTDPNLAAAAAPAIIGKPPKQQIKSKKRVSISPKKPTTLSPRTRRRSSSHFASPASSVTNGKGDEEEGIGWTLLNNDSSDDEMNPITKAAAAASRGLSTIHNGKKSPNKSQQQRRRRRSSARFLRLSLDGPDSNTNEDNGGGGSPQRSGGEFTSSEHLGEIYRQAIRMNAENKINAGNSWGLKLIENMDKFIEEDGASSSPRASTSPAASLALARKMKSKDDKGRVNFTKGIVHPRCFRSDNGKKGGEEKDGGEEGGGNEVGKNGSSVRRRNGERKGNMETIESNLANINMSKLDSAYDIDPLFHKMSKSFDEGGAKGLLLGNLGVSSKGCHIVFDSKEEFGEEQTSKDADEQKLEGIDEENEEDTDGEEEERFNIDPEDAVVWKESEIDITSLAVKLENMLHAYGAKSSDSVPFVPQLESLRNDYAALEEEGFAVDEKDASRGEGRRRQHLYDAPEEEEKGGREEYPSYCYGEVSWVCVGNVV